MAETNDLSLTDVEKQHLNDTVSTSESDTAIWNYYDYTNNKYNNC